MAPVSNKTVKVYGPDKSRPPLPNPAWATLRSQGTVASKPSPAATPTTAKAVRPHRRNRSGKKSAVVTKWMQDEVRESTADESGAQSSSPTGTAKPGAKSGTHTTKIKKLRKKRSTPAPPHLQFSETSSSECDNSENDRRTTTPTSSVPPAQVNLDLGLELVRNGLIVIKQEPMESMDMDIDTSTSVAPHVEDTQAAHSDIESDEFQELDEVVPMLDELQLGNDGEAFTLQNDQTPATPATPPHGKGSTGEGTGGSPKKADTDVHLPIRQIARKLRARFPAYHVEKGSAIHAAGIIYALTSDVLSLAGNITGKSKRQTIEPRHIEMAVRMDEEQSRLWKDVIIPKSYGGIRSPNGSGSVYRGFASTTFSRR